MYQIACVLPRPWKRLLPLVELGKDFHSLGFCIYGSVILCHCLLVFLSFPVESRPINPSINGSIIYSPLCIKIVQLWFHASKQRNNASDQINHAARTSIDFVWGDSSITLPWSSCRKDASQYCAMYIPSGDGDFYQVKLFRPDPCREEK